MQTTTAVSPVYVPREHIKQKQPIRAKREALRIDYERIEAAGQADSPRGRELRAQIAVLSELIAGTRE